jgi:hypothetical protein
MTEARPEERRTSTQDRTTGRLQAWDAGEEGAQTTEMGNRRAQHWALPINGGPCMCTLLWCHPPGGG